MTEAEPLRPLRALEARVDHAFQNEALLVRALTHRSYVNETAVSRGDNQRLELLGDAVLGLVITHDIFTRHPGLDEGTLSKMKAQLVCEATLAELARGVDLGDHLYLGRGEALSGGRDKSSVLADAYEALIAAIYLDAGLDAARRFVLREHRALLEGAGAPVALQDARSQLQELVQDRAGTRPAYQITDTSGPPHQRVFTASVSLGAQVVGVGHGRTKKEAQRRAAAEALQTLRARVGGDAGG